MGLTPACGNIKDVPVTIRCCGRGYWMVSNIGSWSLFGHHKYPMDYKSDGMTLRGAL